MFSIIPTCSPFTSVFNGFIKSCTCKDGTFRIIPNGTPHRLSTSIWPWFGLLSVLAPASARSTAAITVKPSSIFAPGAESGHLKIYKSIIIFHWCRWYCVIIHILMILLNQLYSATKLLAIRSPILINIIRDYSADSGLNTLAANSHSSPSLMQSPSVSSFIGSPPNRNSSIIKAIFVRVERLL